MLAQPNTQPHPPLPVTIVSGYLGAGKTTLVNAILAGDHGLRIAVLVNDFGKVAVDEALIVNTDGDVVALANGCMCCQVGGDLYDAIDRILRMRERFDHLLIETSGVADPANLAQIAVAEPDLEMSRTIVLVDAINFIEVLQDPRLKDTILRQLRAADSIFFTKTQRTDCNLSRTFAKRPRRSWNTDVRLCTEEKSGVSLASSSQKFRRWWQLLGGQAPEAAFAAVR